MESIILIGNDDFGIKSINKMNFKKSIKSYFSTDTRYVVEYEDGHVFFDFSSNFINDYEKIELAGIPFSKPNFVMLSSSDKKKIEETIKDNEFDINIFVDNDHGLIVNIQEYKKIIKVK